MNIYFDTCCYNQPYDGDTQERIRQESLAVRNLAAISRRRKYRVVGSPALTFEIGQIKDAVKLSRVQGFYHRIVTETVHYSRGIATRARYLAGNSNLSEPDSLHLSFAEAAGVDILLTTDDDFETAASGLSTAVRVINPVKFLKEVTL